MVAHSWAGGVAVLLADRRPDLVTGLVLVGAACTPDSLDAVDRLLGLPAVGDVLTVAGLLALGEVLPRARRLTPWLPARLRDPVRATLPDQGVLGGERGALGRHRRTFTAEQRALLQELPEVQAALGGDPGAHRGGGRALGRRRPPRPRAGRWPMPCRGRADRTTPGRALRGAGRARRAGRGSSADVAGEPAVSR